MRTFPKLLYRIYRILLFVYPREFRADYALEMVDTLRERETEVRSHERRLSLLRFWCRELFAVIGTGLRYRWDKRRTSATPFLLRTKRMYLRFATETLLQDVRFGFRSLRKRPIFASVVVLTLALGIGATTIIFSVVNSILFRPLPYPKPDRLVELQHTDSISFSYPEYEAWLELNRVFEEFGIYARDVYALFGGDHPEQALGAGVTSGVFSALDVRPMLGRFVLPDDDRIGAPGIAVLSYSLWERSYGGDPGILGRTLHKSEGSYTIVGVMPQGFQFPIGCELWTSFTDEDRKSYGSRMGAIARLRTGLSLGQAQTELESITERVAERLPAEREYHVRLVSYMEGLVGNVRLPLLILLVVVSVVLLIACTNVASLLLVRRTEQSRELAVRSALGAGLGRLLSQLVGEGLALSLMGGLIGSCLAFTLLRPFAALLPAEIPRVTEIGLDHRVLVFGILLSVSTGLFIGVLPAFGAGRDPLSTLLQGSGRRFTGSLRRNRLQAALVVSEIALTFVLLIGAGLLVKSFVRLTSVNPGFASENMLTLYVEPPVAKYDSEVVLRALYLELAERLEAVPGVQAVASSSQMPFADGTMSYAIHLESRPDNEAFHIECSIVTASYFQVMGIPIIAGRAFTPEEDRSAAPVVIISQEMAERFWPDGEAIGQRVRTRITDTPSWFTIVGVAGDVHHQGLGVDPHPKFYIPFSSGIDDDQTFAIRTHVSPAGIVGAAQDAIWATDPDILVAHVSTFDDLISRSIANPRFQTVFLSSFSALSSVIAVVGIFGLLACSVAQRTHEIGIRMALGAGHRNVMFSILRRGLVLAGTGLTIGLILSLFAVRVLKSYLFEISPTDPPTLVAVTVLFASAAMAASYIPARRATRVDPMLAIKHE